MKKLFTILLTILMTLSLVACGKAPQGDNAVKTRTITDYTVEIPEKAGSVVCVGVGALRYTCYMDAEDLVVGVEDCEITPVISRLYNYVNIEKFKDLPVMGTNGNPYPEEIIKLAPDVIVMSKSASVEADTLQKQTGTPVVVVPGSDTTLDQNAYDTIRIMGELYGMQTRAAELTAYLQNIQIISTKR